MNTAEIVGVCGFILAFLHICWQVWLQRSQNRERVRARVSLGSKPCVRVHNIGVVPVHLTGVELVIAGDGDGATRKFPFQAVLVVRCLSQKAGSLGEESWQLRGTPTYHEPLTRGNAYIFVLPKEAAPLSELLANADELNMWVSISSNGGEVDRLKKKDVVAYLADVARQNHA